MKKDIKKVYFANPIAFKNSQTDAIDEAYKLLLDSFNEYLEKYELSEREVDIFYDLFKKVYFERKASMFFENKLNNIAEELNKSITFAIKKLNPIDENSSHDYSRVFFYHNKHRLINNEQY